MSSEAENITFVQNSTIKPLVIPEYTGFELIATGQTPEEYQDFVKQMYGGVVPQPGHIVEWVVDVVEETETSFYAKGHFRSRPDPLNNTAD